MIVLILSLAALASVSVDAQVPQFGNCPEVTYQQNFEPEKVSTLPVFSSELAVQLYDYCREMFASTSRESTTSRRDSGRYLRSDPSV